MSDKIYLWLEDREGKSGFVFWKTMMQQLFPEVVVQSKKNNSELIKAVKALDDETGSYIIVLDNSFDNLQLVSERKRLQQYAMSKNNIYLVDFVCFEYLLLEFEYLLDWIYAPEDEFRIKRQAAINARNRLVEMLCRNDWSYKTAREIISYDINLKDHNVEQLSAKLLFDLTRNTGFEVSKGSIGECWINSCCDWQDRQSDDICGLDNSRLSVRDKMKQIFNHTSIHKELYGVFPEVFVC